MVSMLTATIVSANIAVKVGETSRSRNMQKFML